MEVSVTNLLVPSDLESLCLYTINFPHLVGSAKQLKGMVMNIP